MQIPGTHPAQSNSNLWNAAWNLHLNSLSRWLLWTLKQKCLRSHPQMRAIFCSESRGSWSEVGMSFYKVFPHPDPPNRYYLCLKKWRLGVPCGGSLPLGVITTSQSFSLELHSGSHKQRLPWQHRGTIKCLRADAWISHSSDPPSPHCKFREPLDRWSQPWSPCRLAERYHFIRTSNKTNTPLHSPGNIRWGRGDWLHERRAFGLSLSIPTRLRVLQTYPPMSQSTVIVLTLPRPPVTARVWRKEKVNAEWRERVLGYGTEQQTLVPAWVVRIRDQAESWVDTKEVAELEILTPLSKGCT